MFKWGDKKEYVRCDGFVDGIMSLVLHDTLTEGNCDGVVEDAMPR